MPVTWHVLRRLVTHDEGSCWVPAEIRNSIILSHWGRKVQSLLFNLWMWMTSSLCFSSDAEKSASGGCIAAMAHVVLYAIGARALALNLNGCSPYAG